MKKLLARLFLVSMISLSGIWGTAHADGVGGWITDRDFSQVYYGVSIGDGSFEIDGSDDSSAALISGTAGLSLIDFLGVEFQVGTASDDSQSLFSESQLFYGAAMLRLGLRFERVGIYALVGQALLNTDSSLNFSTSGEALGFGINLFGNRTTSLNFHFLRLNDGAFTTASIGFQYYFGGFR